MYLNTDASHSILSFRRWYLILRKKPQTYLYYLKIPLQLKAQLRQKRPLCLLKFLIMHKLIPQWQKQLDLPQLFSRSKPRPTPPQTSGHLNDEEWCPLLTSQDQLMIIQEMMMKMEMWDCFQYLYLQWKNKREYKYSRQYRKNLCCLSSKHSFVLLW